MSDHNTPDAAWFANYERANKLANEYSAKEGHSGGSDLYRLAMSAVTRSRPTMDDRKNPEWSGLFTPATDWSDGEREQWEAAEEKRKYWGDSRRAIVASNAKADADRVAAREAEAQAQRDAELASLTETMRTRWLTLVGGTEDNFEAALPELLENHRRRLMTETGTADDAALAAHKAAFHI